MPRKLNKKEIEENLRAVENGKALTMPLSFLNGEFKREYNLRTGADVPMISSSPYPAELRNKYERICVVCGRRFKTIQKTKIYCTKNCRKIRQVQRDRDPEYLKRRREKAKKYYQKPENKERLKEWHKKYQQEHRKEINAYARKRTKKLKRQGLCSTCGRERKDKRFVTCSKCREKTKEWRKKHYGRNKSKIRR